MPLRPPLSMQEHSSLKELRIETLRLTEGSPAIGKSPNEMDLGFRTGIQIVAVKRRGQLISHELSELELLLDDVIYCVGKDNDFHAYHELICGKP